MTVREEMEAFLVALEHADAADRAAIMDPLRGLLREWLWHGVPAVEVGACLATAGDTTATRRLWADAQGIRRTAYHEAGHAVVGAVHGLRFSRVSIQPNDVDALGCVIFADLALRPIRSREHAELVAMMQLAGPLSERCGALGPTSETLDTHRALARDVLEVSLPAWTVEARGILCSALERLTEETLASHRGWLERVVGQLLAQRTLSEADVYALSADPIALHVA